MKLGELIAAYMKLHSHSYRELAKEIGCDHSTLHRLVSGKAVRMDMFNKLLVWLTHTPK